MADSPNNNFPSSSSKSPPPSNNVFNGFDNTEDSSPSPPSSNKNSPPSHRFGDYNEKAPPPANQDFGDKNGKNFASSSDGGNGNGNGNGNGGSKSTPSMSSPNSSEKEHTSKHHRLYPSERYSTPSSSSSAGSPPSGDGSEKGLDETAIIGIAVGAGVLILLIILLVYCCSRKKKNSKDVHYRPPHPRQDDEYYKHATPNHQQWNNGSDHIMSMPPGPGGAAKNWVTPPHLHQMPSTDMSNASYSGPHGPVLPPPHPSVALGFNKSTFSFEELSAATGGYASSNLLGQGGFGYVHKGVLPNGKEIAVKSLKSTGGQGDREFQAEVEIISRVHHRHLVSLVGYAISESQKLLVYEFVPNKTLEYHLHGKGRPVMDWGTRLKIAIGSAKGLAYLHEDCHPRIIHRDIKAANILIEDNFEAKVADFGLAKFNADMDTHVSTRVMGTFGYLAPEYASSGKLTEKSDVFSYGIMLLELITGRRPIDTTGEYEDDSLVDWARPLCINAMETGNFEGLVDPRLEKNYDRNEMARMIACASASVRHSARKRSKMSQIVRALEGDVSLDDLSEGGMKPGQSTVFGTGSSGEYDASTYSADMKKFRKLAFDSSCDTSEIEGTSDYGHNQSASSSDRSTEIGRGTGSRMHNL